MNDTANLARIVAFAFYKPSSHHVLKTMIYIEQARRKHFNIGDFLRDCCFALKSHILITKIFKIMEEWVNPPPPLSPLPSPPVPKGLYNTFLVVFRQS